MYMKGEPPMYTRTPEHYTPMTYDKALFVANENNKEAAIDNDGWAFTIIPAPREGMWLVAVFENSELLGYL
jgi:hypothetical protein